MSRTHPGHPGDEMGERRHNATRSGRKSERGRASHSIKEDAMQENSPGFPQNAEPRGWLPKEGWQCWEVGVDVMVKKYRVALAEEEQQELKGLVGRGRAELTGRPTPASCCSAMRTRPTGP